ncbi:hypothetical protein [Sphingomonas prati]|uniref:Uncharacterized protein n=1 Tax=Sphingomonas prati TaxID=1843237 RepID=A0A7W9BV41_9SPHN|nr:hypothetical protein [Sphingomonas prati]MBB5730570.1 hypothetical protein [Sphingomonas prati]GGE95032.1 hypothetical protein GCM10011404_30190 [Sphingomonas prati]
MTRVERIAMRRQLAVIARVAARLRAAFPELDVIDAADGVTLVGRGLSRRMLDDVRLRDLRGMIGEDGT